jgi:hypothetical protein
MNIIQTDINPEKLNLLYEMLNDVIIPKTNLTSKRVNNSEMRRICFGKVRYRFPKKTLNYKLQGESRFTKMYPEIYDELKLVINQIYPDFTYTTIQVNHNGIMDYHTDKNNMGDTVIISFGEYTGGNLVLKNGDVETQYDMNCSSIRFNATTIPHKVNDDLVGNKYSLIYFTMSSFLD